MFKLFGRSPRVTVINTPPPVPQQYLADWVQKEIAGRVGYGKVVEIRMTKANQLQITARPDNERYEELHQAVLINDSMPATLTCTAQVIGDFPVEICNLAVPRGTFLRGFLFSTQE